MNIDQLKEAALNGRLIQFRLIESRRNKAIDDEWQDYEAPFTFCDVYEYRMGGTPRLEEIIDKLINIGNELQVLIQREGWDEQIGDAIDELEKAIATIGLELPVLP